MMKNMWPCTGLKAHRCQCEVQKCPGRRKGILDSHGPQSFPMPVWSSDEGNLVLLGLQSTPMPVQEGQSANKET